MEDSVTNGQLMDMGNDGDLGDSPTRAAPLISPQSAERCRYYPGCIQGEKCPFFHPTFPCKLVSLDLIHILYIFIELCFRAFPSCSFGDKCRFIHPSCKFDGHCKNPSCPYAHSSPKQKPSKMGTIESIYWIRRFTAAV